MRDRRRIEGVLLTHPLGDKSLLTRISHEPIMWLSIGVLLRTHPGPLTVQRVIGIENDDVSTLVMGSMQILCSAARSRC
jgi:hypothetical protein